MTSKAAASIVQQATQSSPISTSASQGNVSVAEWLSLFVDKELVAGRKIASGTFGSVFEGTYRGKPCAIKLSRKLKQDSDKPIMLHTEYQYYLAMQTAIRKLKLENDSEWPIPKTILYKHSQSRAVLLLSLLGPSLKQLQQQCGNKLSLFTVMFIAIKVLKLLEFIHACGIIHRDIKPENIVIGRDPGQQQQFYLIDFGLAFDINSKQDWSMDGTPKYIGYHAAQMERPSPRDDLQSLGYMLISLARDLPWSSSADSTSRNVSKDPCPKLKHPDQVHALCIDLPIHFQRYMELVNSLKQKDEVDYDLLIALWVHGISSMFPRHSRLDWQLLGSSVSPRHIERKDDEE